MADEDFEEDEPGTEEDLATDSPNQASSDILPPNSLLGLDNSPVDGPATALTTAAPRYWRVGTREGADRIDRWPAMCKGNFVSIGWSELGDIDANYHMFDRDEALERIADFLQPHVTRKLRSLASNYARQWYAFAAEVDVNDYVVTMDGQRLLGIGIVNGPYVFDSGDALQKHHRSVQWLNQPNVKWKGHPGHMTSVANFTHDEAAVKFVKDRLAGVVNPSILKEEDYNVKSAAANNTVSLNQILYGPPGTGKTFATATRAVAIINNDAPDERAEIMAVYKELQSTGQIAFVTFHQSYAYEDFIEGIRPVMDDSSEGGIPRYECKPGILKEIAARAAFDMLELTFDNLWDMFVARIKEHPEQIYEGHTAESEYTILVHGPDMLYGTNSLNPKMVTTLRCGRDTMAAIYMRFPGRPTVTPAEIRDMRGKEHHDYFISSVFRELIAFKHTMATSTERDKQEIVQRYHKLGFQSGYRIKPESEWNRFILIIDEINRGNISKILGELITLLEDDKRFGNENALTVTLPYSRDQFGLPANLHIIGTMNTADKSIALVDIALRRRFDFEELVPDFSVCDGLTQGMREVLTTLNERITARKDRDHRIGHAFFVRVKSSVEFETVWKRKIVPLLLEYFYGDWDGLRYVLGEAGSNITGFVRSLPGSDRDARTRFQWHGDSDAPVVDALGLLAANYRIALSD